MSSALEHTTRRNFLKGIAGILAAGVAPAAIGSGILMPIRQLWTPPYRPWASAYCMGWSVVNNGSSDVTLVGLYDKEIYIDSGDIIIRPGEVISYDSKTRVFSRRRA